MREFKGRSHFERLSHAYIALGQDADDLALAAVCSAGVGDGGSATAAGGKIPCGVCKDCSKAARHIHPDIITVSRLKDDHGKLRREIIVDQIRAIKTEIYIAPNEAARKVYIIDDAELMNVNAQNAFLQMLEEPPTHIVFILKTLNPAALLPTVRSRCVNLTSRHGEAETQDGGVCEAETQDGGVCVAQAPSRSLELAREFTAALGDNLRLTRCMFHLDKLDRSDFAGFIGRAREGLAEALRTNPRNKSAAAADDLLVQASEMLELNVSVGHVAGMLCANLIQAI